MLRRLKVTIERSFDLNQNPLDKDDFITSPRLTKELSDLTEINTLSYSIVHGARDRLEPAPERIRIPGPQIKVTERVQGEAAGREGSQDVFQNDITSPLPYSSA